MLKFTNFRKSYEERLFRAGIDPSSRLPDKPVPLMNADEREEFSPFEMLDDNTVRVNGAFDPIFGMDVRDLIKILDEREPTSLHMIIESPGGLADDGMALMTDLRARVQRGMTFTVEAQGLLASAGTMPYIVADKDKRTIVDGSMMMIHEVQGGLLAFGNVASIREEADRVVTAMEAYNSNYINQLTTATGQRKPKLTKDLKTDKWFTAQEAVDYGLAGEVTGARTSSTSRKQRASLTNLMSFVAMHDDIRSVD